MKFVSEQNAFVVKASQIQGDSVVFSCSYEFVSEKNAMDRIRTYFRSKTARDYSQLSHVRAISTEQRLLHLHDDDRFAEVTGRHLE